MFVQRFCHCFAVMLKLLRLIGLLKIAFAYNCDNHEIPLTSLSVPQEYQLFEHIGYAYPLVRATQYRSVTVTTDIQRKLAQVNELTLAYQQNSSYDFVYTRYPELIPSVPNQKLVKFPVAAGSIVITFNLPGISQLNLSVEHLPDIYEGEIAYWNDSLIQAVNPGITLPYEKILQVARLDDADDTLTFTRYLKHVDQNETIWRPFLSANFTGGLCCNSRNWPTDVRYYGKDFVGTAGIVMSLPYTIAYLSTVVADSYDIPYATLINTQGHLVTPTTRSVHLAMRNAYDSQNSLDLNLFDTADPDAYPIVYLVYFVFNIQLPNSYDCCKLQETVGLVEFLFNESRTIYESNLVVPILTDMKTKIRQEILSTLKCQGNDVYSDYLVSLIPREIQIDQSWAVWKIIVTTVGVALAVCAIFTTAWLWTRAKQNRLEEAKWLIPFDKIRPLDVSDSQGDFEGRSKPWEQRFQFVHTVVQYGGVQVCLEQFTPGFPLPARWKDETKAAMRYLRRKFHHPNLAVFHGVTFEGPTKVFQVYSISEFLSKGSLHYILKATKHDLDINVKYSMACDVAEGLLYLHRTGLYVGSLNSLTCSVDSHWTVKLKQWHQGTLYASENQLEQMKMFTKEFDNIQNDVILIHLLYVEPNTYNKHRFTVDSDTYSFGLLLFEIFTRGLPYWDEVELGVYTYKEVMALKLVMMSLEPPNMPDTVPTAINQLIRNCVAKESNVKLGEVVKRLKSDRPSPKGIVDIVMDRMEDHMESLERKVKERTADMIALTDRMRELLNEMLPKEIAAKLLSGIEVDPEQYESVSVLFSDIVGFTTLSSMSSPLEVMIFLNELWVAFDAAIQQFDAYKVDTIGDAYMVCSGLPKRNGLEHVRQLGLLALALLRVIDNFTVRHKPELKLKIRLGINSGPATAGIVGTKMPQYCVFGDTVNTAARMESTGLPMKIQISQATELIMLECFPEFTIESRGLVEIKGKGQMNTYWLTGVKGS